MHVYSDYHRHVWDSDDSDEVTDTEATNPKKDLSQRPDHYKTMKAEVLVVHDCDKDMVVPPFSFLQNGTLKYR